MQRRKPDRALQCLWLSLYYLPLSCEFSCPVESAEEVAVLGEKVNGFVGLLGCQVHLKASPLSTPCPWPAPLIRCDLQVKMQGQGCLSPRAWLEAASIGPAELADSRFDDFRVIFSDIAHLQQDMSVQAPLASWQLVVMYLLIRRLRCVLLNRRGLAKRRG